MEGYNYLSTEKRESSHSVMETKVTEGFQEEECLEMSKEEKAKSDSFRHGDSGDIWENSLMEVNMMKSNFRELGREGEEVRFS